MRNQRDTSYDLTLREDSVLTAKKSVFRNIVDTVSKSIEKLTTPKKADYEKMRIEFSQFLTDDILAKYSQILSDQSHKLGFYSAEDENNIINIKNELVKFSSYLKYLQTQRKEDISADKSLKDYCSTQKLKFQGELNGYKEIIDYVKTAKTINAKQKAIIDFKMEQMNKARFEKMKMVENRGRVLANIKNIECMLNEIQAQGVNISDDKKERLLFFRQELINVLRDKIRLEDAQALRKRIAMNQKQIEYLKESLGKLEIA